MENPLTEREGVAWERDLNSSQCDASLVNSQAPYDLDLGEVASLVQSPAHWASCATRSAHVELPNGADTDLTVCAHGLTRPRSVPKFSYHGQAAATAHDAYVDALLALGCRWLVWRFTGGLAFGKVQIEGGLFVASIESAIEGRITPTQPALPGQHVYPQAALFQKVPKAGATAAAPVPPAPLRERLRGAA